MYITKAYLLICVFIADQLSQVMRVNTNNVYLSSLSLSLCISRGGAQANNPIQQMGKQMQAHSRSEIYIDTKRAPAVHQSGNL